MLERHIKYGHFYNRFKIKINLSLSIKNSATLRYLYNKEGPSIAAVNAHWAHTPAGNVDTNRAYADGFED